MTQTIHPAHEKKKRSSLEGKEAESTILHLIEAQQAAIEEADEKDERMFEAKVSLRQDTKSLPFLS